MCKEQGATTVMIMKKYKDRNLGEISAVSTTHLVKYVPITLSPGHIISHLDRIPIPLLSDWLEMFDFRG